ncbi:acyl-CoA/acyl-ACP dehydrogenase [Crossiella sp. SN42]|uniref:acyl-CoA dehydrogenase family protein n=1 Tax=Crossiella sp. SN42 TaxID=2944808 RepID=UPI00207D1092|nr:acyl-CoA dehydrogenase family protein [Crossiella sp. SN42]MCO1578755.1 acyl-CoA/acyl-ACP dehydrogenase [Crossiella sp. SN42]
MDLGLTEEQLALRATIRSAISRGRREIDLGLSIPDTYGGQGGGLAEVAVALGELRLMPNPLLSSTLAAQAILATGNQEACARLLPRIAAGEPATLAWTDHTGHWDTPACAYDGTLTGTAHYVLDGDLTLVLARTETGPALMLPKTCFRVDTNALDPTRPLATVECADTPAEHLGPADPAALRDLAVTLLAYEQAEIAAEALARTVDYAKNRVQFGRPIGSFQAIKHRLADLHLTVETARSAALHALLNPGPEQAALAKVHCSEALSTVAGEMIQLHGGIAITWEHEAHLFFKRAHGSAQLFGSPEQHLDRLTELLGFTPSQSAEAR